MTGTAAAHGQGKSQIFFDSVRGSSASSGILTAEALEKDLYRRYPALLDTLLQDRTTGTNIVWATDSYAGRGDGYQADQPLYAGLIIREKDDIIRPRSVKAKEEQDARTRSSAEVFTPSRVCREMIDALDEDWFEESRILGESASSTLPRKLREGKTWEDYVRSTYLEITCGEAPFLASRYDAATGLPIDMRDRFGVLDRKLQMVNAHARGRQEWLQWACEAYRAVYGYELLGDNLIIARENLLYTFIEYYMAKFRVAPAKAQLFEIAGIIAWNLWQMEGLSGATPHGHPPDDVQLDFFEDSNPESQQYALLPCIIREWAAGATVRHLELSRNDAMKFDHIIGNPPYQKDAGGAGRQATPLYDSFVTESEAMARKSVALITPSRWFGGGMALDRFRNHMMTDRHIQILVDYPNAKDCFPDRSVNGGVSYFIWNRQHDGMCRFTTVANGDSESVDRYLDEFSDMGIVPRYSQLLPLLRRLAQLDMSPLSQCVSALDPFGIPTTMRGEAKPQKDDDVRLRSSKGCGYVPRAMVTRGLEAIDKYKVLISKMGAEHALEPDKNGQFQVLSGSLQVLDPGEVCTHSYLIAGPYSTRSEAAALEQYLRTKFVRALVLEAMSASNVTTKVFSFVPTQDFTDSADIDWSAPIADINRQLYRKYDLTEEEMQFIESHVKEMR